MKQYFAINRVFKGSYRQLAVCLVFFIMSLVMVAGASADEIVCIQCHAALPEKFSQPVKLWKGSVHEENGIACNACHGGDAKDAANAMKKERGFLGAPKYTDVPEFCGRCHVGVLKDYLGSAHGRALARGGANCVICHGSHSIVKASLELINEKSCSRCHTYERAKPVKGAMQETEAMISAIDARIKLFKQTGADTEGMEKELFSTRNSFRSLFHNVDVRKVTDDAARIKGELKKIEKALAALEEQKQQRKKIGMFVVAGALIAALFAHLLKKTFD